MTTFSVRTLGGGVVTYLIILHDSMIQCSQPKINWQWQEHWKNDIRNLWNYTTRIKMTWLFDLLRTTSEHYSEWNNHYVFLNSEKIRTLSPLTRNFPIQTFFSSSSHTNYKIQKLVKWLLCLDNMYLKRIYSIKISMIWWPRMLSAQCDTNSLLFSSNFPLAIDYIQHPFDFELRIR